MCNYNDETSTNVDVVRVINKFDIYMCDLGEITNDRGNTLGKVRPCVIVNSDDIINIFSNQFVVVPIRTIHENINETNLEEYVQKERSIGRIAVPIKMENKYCVLDVNQIRQVPSIKVTRYCGSILKPDLRQKINQSLMELLFSRYEFTSANNRTKRVENYQAEPILIEEKAEEPKKESVKKKSNGGRKTVFAQGFSLYYKAWAEGKMSAEEVSKKCGTHISTTYNHIKKYHELHPEIDVKVKTKMW